MTHGTASGYVMGCRCVKCTRAQRDRMRAYRAAKVTSDAFATKPLENQGDPATAPTVRGHGNQERGS
jgi:hypothetical protein